MNTAVIGQLTMQQMADFFDESTEVLRVHHAGVITSKLKHPLYRDLVIMIHGAGDGAILLNVQ